MESLGHITNELSSGQVRESSTSPVSPQQEENTGGKRISPDLVVTSPNGMSMSRPLQEVHSISAKSLASNSSIPIDPASAWDCGASLVTGADSGFYSGAGSEALSYLYTGRRDSSDGLVEAGINKYLLGDINTASLLLSEAVGQQVNHALELEYGVDDWAGISVDSHMIPKWMTGELSEKSPINTALDKRLEVALFLMKAVPSCDKYYLDCGSILCLMNQWDEAREIYRQGISTCDNKKQLRAALGHLNGVDRVVTSVIEATAQDIVMRRSMSLTQRESEALGQVRERIASTSSSQGSVVRTMSAPSTHDTRGTRIIRNLKRRWGSKPGRSSSEILAEEGES